MRSLVWFRAQGRPYAVDVNAVLGVRDATALLPLPGASQDVCGMLAVEGTTVPVLSILTDRGRHVLLLTSGQDAPYGMAVDEVTAVEAVADADIGPSPGAGSSPFNGSVQRDGDVVLLVDPAALARRHRDA
jgi:chemotaxis signal transduction protein